MVVGWWKTGSSSKGASLYLEVRQVGGTLTSRRHPYMFIILAIFVYYLEKTIIKFNKTKPPCTGLETGIFYFFICSHMLVLDKTCE